MNRLMILSVALCLFACGDGKKQPSYMPGTYELFFGVDVTDRVCNDGVFTASLKLRSSDLADSVPDAIRVLHWDFMEDVWTDLETIDAEVGTEQAYSVDLNSLGGCETQGLSLVLVATSNRAYGHVEFVTLEKGASWGGGSSYSFETQLNTVNFRCPIDEIDRAEATIYNFKTRRSGTPIDLTPVMPDEMVGTSNDIWEGTTPALRPSRDVVIFEGKKDDTVICSFLL